MPRVSAKQGEPQVRLGFQLFATDNPLLVAELLKLPKGHLRHTRLVTLATIGLLMERGAVAGETPPVPAVAHWTTDQHVDDVPPISPLSRQEFSDIDADHDGESAAGMR